MKAALKWRNWSTPNLAWSFAVIGAASAGLFLGLDQPAHSDISKYQAILAEHDRMPGEVIVKVSRSGLSSIQMQGVDRVFDASRFQIASIEAFETNASFYLVKLSGDMQTAQFLSEAERNPSIEYAEPNYVVRAIGNAQEVLPNDPEFAKLWGLQNLGQKDSRGTEGLPGADIGATKAWATTTGNREIVVGVIDTGVDYTHPDLAANIWLNPGESEEANGIDDDGNGFVDDRRGWNFVKNSNDPMDDNDHGTHVAGTIAAEGNDGRGIAGVNWTGSILPIKFLDGRGGGTLANAVKSIQYGTLMNVHMTNNSWGGGGFTQSMFDAIKEANDKGQLFIAAAGNSSQNSDQRPHYPAGYQIDNVIAVAATTNRDTLASFSTYGKRTVHIAAPGHNIFSTTAKGKYASFSGTSMASPHVAGAAALLWGTDTSMTAAEVKDRLLRSRDYVPGLMRTVAVSGRLNVYNAINGIYPPAPEPMENAWMDMAMPGPIESEHPYENRASQEWTIEGPADAKFMRVIFSKVDTEANRDVIRIFDGNGVEMDAISGKAENHPSFFVTGNKLVIKFTSDTSRNGWGFAVDKVQAQ